jgi:hypothetical protein
MQIGLENVVMLVHAHQTSQCTLQMGAVSSSKTFVSTYLTRQCHLKMKAVGLSEILVYTYQTRQCLNPEEHNLEMNPFPIHLICNLSSQLCDHLYFV